MANLREKDDYTQLDRKSYTQSMKENFETVFMMGMAKLHGRMVIITKENFSKIKRKVLEFTDLKMEIYTWEAITIHFLKATGSQFLKTAYHFKECGKTIRCKVLS